MCSVILKVDGDVVVINQLSYNLWWYVNIGNLKLSSIMLDF